MPLAPPERLRDFKARDALIPSLKFGALTGTTAFALGATWGLYRSRRPRLFALTATFHGFALGTTFWATRSLLLHIRPFTDAPPRLPGQSPRFTDPPTAFDRLTASTLSGSVSGALIGSMISGHRGIVTGALQIALLGYLGQRGFAWADERRTRQVELAQRQREDGGRTEGWIDQIASLKWTGLTKLSDEEYIDMLGEKALRIEAQIALIEEEIEGLKAEEGSRKGGGSERGEEGKLVRKG